MAAMSEDRHWAVREIDIGDRRQVSYWSRRFGVSPDELINAVDEVGPSAAAVATEVRLRRPCGTAIAT